MFHQDNLLLSLIFLLFIARCHGIFTPNRFDFNSYGVKLAMNEVFLVLARNGNDPPSFFIQLAPYNDTSTSSQCSISYPDVDHFVFNVVLGKKQTTGQMHFYFAGELTNNRTGLFVGIVILNYTNIINGRNSTNKNTSLICESSFTYQMQYFTNYAHQEYYTLGVEPQGRWVFGFSTDFLFIFDSRTTSTLKIWNGNSTWLDATFIPNAVDISDNFGVVSGFTFNGQNFTIKYSPMIYLINWNSITNIPQIVHFYEPIPTPDTWQDLLTNADANTYLPKYEMSVSINDNGFILVGMQFLNRVFLLSVNVSRPTFLNFVSRNTNGRSLGNGKSVAWLRDGIAALIVNVYTLEYQWTASQVQVYGIESFGYNSNSTPLSIFPNNHQKLPTTLDPVFDSIASSPSSLALLDRRGRLLIFLAAPAGFYLVTEDTGTMPLITSSRPCDAGTFKNQSGIHDCTLCPPGMRNPGNSPTFCIPCSAKSFCPLASVYEVPKTALKSIIQAIPYPKSPDSVTFDEILIQNMFSIGSGRCLLISPLLWTLVVAGVAVLIVIVMGYLKYFTKNYHGRRVRSLLKCFFLHTDLIGEGELWVGGLASFSAVVLIIFACVFSQNYVKQYPIETSEDSTFACDLTMRNAKFETSIQSLAIPLSSADQMMFDLLNDQKFILSVDFINTLITCDAVSLEALYGITWSTIRWLTCGNINSTLSLTVSLPFQHVSVQIYVTDSRTIGALRIGLYGIGQNSEVYTLQELNFLQAFSKNEQILARNLPVTISLTKVVNETLPIDNNGYSLFGGIYIPTFTVDYNSLFFTADQFVRSTLTSTTLQLTLSETPYYVKNVQQPIAKPSEIVFQNLLFITVCLELFGLVFLSYKLLFKPFYYSVLKKKKKSDYPPHQRKEELSQRKIVENEYKVATSEVRINMNDFAYF